MYQHNIIKYKFYENITRQVSYLSNNIFLYHFGKTFYFVNVFASFAHSMDVHISPHHPSIRCTNIFSWKNIFSLFFFYKKGMNKKSENQQYYIWKEAKNKWKLLIKQDCESQCIHNLIRNTRYDSQSNQSNYFSPLFLFIVKSFAYCHVWIYFYIFVCFIPQAWHVSGRLWITIVVFCRFCTRHYWLEVVVL